MSTLIKKILFLFCFCPFCLFLSLHADESKPYVLVSVAPHRFFVEKIAGDTIDVGLIVPAGASAHTFEPTPKQMILASQAQIWFRIGESFENKAIRALQSHNSNLQVVDLRQGLDLIAASCSHYHGGGTCHADAMDLHFWLSPRLAQIQASTIANALKLAYPKHAALYEANLVKFKEELRQLDQEITTILAPLTHRTIFVSHPAYGYFCRDYNLKQYSIEVEGKDPTPQQLNQILRMAREFQIRTIYVQPQYSNKGARLIAEQIGAQVVSLDPYSEQYFNSLLEIAHAFAEGSVQ